MDKKTGRKKKRVRLRPQHKWTNEQHISLLKSIVHKINGDPQKFEKPTVLDFYNLLFQEYRLHDLEKIGAWLCKNKMRNLKESYRKAIQLSKEKKIEEAAKYISRCCPHYNMLHKIFGPSADRSNSSKTRAKTLVEINSENAEYSSYESEIENEEIQSISNPELLETNCKRNSFQNINTNCYENLKRPSNPFIQYMAETQEKRNKIEEKKMEMQIEYEERFIQLRRDALELKNQKLEFDRKMEERRLELMNEKTDAELQLKKIELDKDYELKQYELELKYKYNKNNK